MTRRLQLLLAVIVLGGSTNLPLFSGTPATNSKSALHVLLVVAHPDDEYEMAGTVYRIAKELSGKVDQLIITDGEAGYHYSSLAEGYYGVKLADERDAHKRLPQIRREEARRAARILGIEHQWFLNERDDHFTLDAQEVLKKSWNDNRVLENIAKRLQQGHYSHVLVLLPEGEAHGAHKAASILTLQAVERLPRNNRPVILGARAANNEEESYQPLADFPVTATATPSPSLRFDRDARFGYHDSLTYQIVVDWVIAEHKSQGLFQNRCRQDRFENFWMFNVGNDLPANDARILAGGLASGNGQPAQK